MKTGLGLTQQREAYRSVHATTSRPGEAEKLKKLITFKNWRSAGHEVVVIVRRLKTTRESLKKWAKELDFDMGGML